MEKQSKLAENENKNDRRILFILLFLPCLLIRRVLDNDTWFLLNSGRYIMNHGIPYIEPFSIHKNMEFVMQQWLTDVVFWNIYDKFGENGIFLIVMICYAIIIFLMFKLCMKISEGNYFISYATTLLASILIIMYMVTRPTIFTLVIVMIELYALESYVTSGKNKYLLILPVLSMLMINLHAALWPILFVLMLPYLVNSFKFKLGIITSEGYKNRYLFLAVGAMLLVALINPYGIDAMTYLLRSVGYPYMKNIMEIQPPYVNSFTGAVVYTYIVIIAFVYIFYRKGKTNIRFFLLTMGTTYMVLISLRNITYFAICSLFPLSYYLKDFTIKKDNTIAEKNKNMRLILLILITIVVIASGYYNNININTETKYFDLNNTIDYIYKNEDTSSIILYTGFNDGSLVQFRGLPSYIDPRAEVYFKKHNNKEDIFNEYIDLKDGNVYYKDILDKYKFTHLITSEGDILYTYLQNDKDYSKIYENDKYYLFKRIQ